MIEVKPMSLLERGLLSLPSIGMIADTFENGSKVQR